MISFYCAKCHHLITNKHTPETEGQTIINEANLCESCQPSTPYIHHNLKKDHCKKGHLYDGVRFVKGVPHRYCKTCMKESDKKYKQTHINPHHRVSRGQTAPKLKIPKE